MDLSKLAPAHYIPGRQAAIDHVARIDKAPFLISVSILFGSALLSVLARFAIRIFGRRQIRWDDGLVFLATIALIVAFGVCLKLLETLYLVEAINKKAAFPFREDMPKMLDLVKWLAVFAIMNWTSVYMVKFAFMYFFYTLFWGLSLKTVRIYCTSVGLLIVCWMYTVVNPIICPHFGANAAKCGANPHQHVRSLAGNCIVVVLDIICDGLIEAIPIVVLDKSMMPLSQKVSIAALLCLSTVMIICALIRLIGSITDTRKDGSGTAPVWATYWAITGSCISLVMTSVVVIRGVFVTNLIHDDRQKQESVMRRLGRRLLSTLRLSRSSRSSRRSPQRSGDQSPDDQGGRISAPPRIATQGLTRGTLNGVRTFIGGSKNGSRDRDETLKSVDTAYALENVDYHKIRRNEATRPTATPDSTP
ncbi:uncharacterized protein BDZ99DRAFT_487147 [Mytilinidion resinicola]|uniref:Rhodopsin domain-containing protein n=1 Tax=Mytilinidion resinicola TaxID=574789 RepID=A0A6A6YXT7_9PEZI|nr:uncharacterized protein BDZ99DRAFT_487147 [Mytilinidion resinicola]KAF2812735.1 hypothetical protein BDZ99DRAFT_487147 [Mytilinidion resinicola]